MDCHRCRHGQEIEAGKYRGVPWEQVPCSTCELRDWSFFAMEFDEERADKAQEAAMMTSGYSGTYSLSESTTSTTDAGEPMMPVRVMSSLAKGLLALPAGVREVVCRRLCGESYRDIAEAEGVTIQAAEQRHRRAMRLWPELRELFPVKVARAARRARKNRARTGAKSA